MPDKEDINCMLIAHFCLIRDIAMRIMPLPKYPAINCSFDSFVANTPPYNTPDIIISI